MNLEELKQKHPAEYEHHKTFHKQDADQHFYQWALFHTPEGRKQQESYLKALDGVK